MSVEYSSDMSAKCSSDVLPKCSGDVLPECSGDVLPECSGDVLVECSSDMPVADTRAFCNHKEDYRCKECLKNQLREMVPQDRKNIIEYLLKHSPRK